MYRTDTGHDFSLYFAYELLMNLRNTYTQGRRNEGRAKGGNADGQLWSYEL